MNKKIYRFFAFLTAICVIGVSLPAQVTKAAESTVTYDFNGIDFDIDYANGSNLASDSCKAVVLTDTTAVPSEFTGSVTGGGNAAYAATRIDFVNEIDLSKVTSIKVRMYVPEYTYTKAPTIRLLNTGSASDGYVESAFETERGGTFGAWNDMELLDLINSSKINKTSRGYLDHFILSIRAYASSDITCYFDSITITYTEDFWVEPEAEPELGANEVKLTYESSGSGAQDSLGRYLIYLSGITDTSDIYWNNNTVYIDGEARSGEGVHYAVLNGMLALCLYYTQIEEDATVASQMGTHMLHIKAGTKIGGGKYTVVNDVWIKLSGSSIQAAETVTLTFASGSAQDAQGRYLIKFDGLTDTSDRYWDNNTVYIDGVAKSGTGVNYAVLDGLLSLCLTYEQIESGVTSATYLNKHTLLIKAGTTLGGKYILSNTLMVELDKYTVTPLDAPDISVTLSNDESRNGANCTQGFYFEVSPTEDLPFSGDWQTRYTMRTGAVYVNGEEVPSAELIKILSNLYYVAFDAYFESGEVFADGSVVTIEGTVTSGEYTVEYLTASFGFDASVGWTKIDYSLPAEDIILCLDDESYIVKYANTKIDGVDYAVDAEYGVAGAHTISYTKYNKDYECQLVLYRIGDANASDAVSLTDLMALKKLENAAEEYSLAMRFGGDIDGDDVIDVSDAKVLRNMLLEVGLLTLSPGEGNVVAKASDEVRTLSTDYDFTAYKVDELSTGEDLYHRDTVVLRWSDFTGGNSYTVNVSRNADMSNATSHTATAKKVELINLLPNTTYYWTVSNGEETSKVLSFVTEDTIRTLTIDSASNTRDIGGYLTASGARVKYGMVFRGSNIDGITELGKSQLLEGLNVKTDLDLRGVGGTSPLGSGVNYYSYSAPYYWGSETGLWTESYREALFGAIRTFADEDNYPVYMHCAIGRDRTGCVSMLINGLLGVGKSDLYLDYEMSLLSASGSADGAKASYLVGLAFNTMYEGIQAYAPDGTYAEACEAFLLDMGITQEEIDSIRAILLEN